MKNSSLGSLDLLWPTMASIPSYLLRSREKQSALRDKQGNVAIIFALFSMPIVLSIGCSIDYARALTVADRMQSALDAAVLAGRNEPIATQIATATAYFNGNKPRHPGATVSVSFARNSDGGLSGKATANVMTTFAGIMNIKTIPVQATSLATADASTTTSTSTTTTQTVKVPGYTPCIHVMSQSANPAWTMVSTSGLDASSCVARIRSNGSSALSSRSASHVSFKKILVKGGASVASGEITIVDAPNKITTDTKQDVTGDPFAENLTAIQRLIFPDQCKTGNTGKTYKGGTVSPGTFCGATTFNGVKFDAGLYIIASGNGNNSNGSLTITGKTDGKSGVTFYFADNKSQFLSYSASEGSSLLAPSSGITRGLLFFEASNRGNAYDFTISSVNKQAWAGVVYLPSMNMTLRSLSEWASMNISLSINTLYMDSLSSVVVPYLWTPYGQDSAITYGATTLTTTTPITTTTTTTKPGYLSN